MALSNLVLDVSRWTDHVVVDRTGLEGKSDGNFSGDQLLKERFLTIE